MAAICIRLDDVHGRTPLKLLRQLDTKVWAGAPIALAVTETGVLLAMIVMSVKIVRGTGALRPAGQ